MVDGKPADLASGESGSEVIVLVARDAGDEEALHVVCTALAVLVDGVVDGAFVVAFEHVDVYDSLADEKFFLHLDHLVAAVLVEDDDVVDRRAVAEVFVFLSDVPMKPSSRSM